ncbi:hypothetical protein ACFX13_024888 [Malus domestica]|uniref:Uncharacterized protein n=1 Tax=Malus domestica TaxID=3750 RepID=A0A498HEX3_MALDO|nr:uncharacterized protein LOC103405046 isoform X1 [Malus domestica]XP_050133803.1 uncharacterized protein LOC126609911 isoform X1 [Malus sylvestris]XP_050133804.1 uncharacterized protein LOC126609911 isoform X1 [Malus sylvestris]RXH67877.1 hypothetical protein DVH24_028024 [Malus domestica]
MATPLWFFRFPPPLLLVLASFLVLIGFMGFGFLSIFLTSMVLIFSTVFFPFSKQKPLHLVENKLIEEKLFIPCLEDAKYQSATPQEKDAEEAPLSSTDLISESECLDHLSTSDDSELVDWSFGDSVARSPDFSDGSISDEDSLIEIALPGGYYVGHKEHDSLFNLQQKMPGLSPQSIFKQHTILELLAEINEMNEEENLFEIDLSVGSIKCSRFEIEA